MQLEPLLMARHRWHGLSQAAARGAGGRAGNSLGRVWDIAPGLQVVPKLWETTELAQPLPNPTYAACPRGLLLPLIQRKQMWECSQLAEGCGMATAAPMQAVFGYLNPRLQAVLALSNSIPITTHICSRTFLWHPGREGPWFPGLPCSSSLQLLCC